MTYNIYNMKKKYLLFLSPFLAVSCSHEPIIPVEEGEHALNTVNKPLNKQYQGLNDDYLSSLTDFSVSLQEMIGYKENNIYSPLSIATCFSMAYEGTNSTTKTELERLLKYTANKDYKSYIKTMLENTSKEIKNQEESIEGLLDVSQSFFIADRYKERILQSYLDTLSDYYYAEAYQGDLESDEMHQLLADWINNKTRDFLEVKKEDFDGYGGIMWLVNTIYLKAMWLEQFSEYADEQGDFNNIDKTTTKMNFMTQRTLAEVLVRDKYDIAVLPLNMGLKFVVLLPHSNDGKIYQNSEAMQDLLSYCKYKKDYEIYDVSFKVPPFKMKSEFDLRDLFINAGYTIPFNPYLADFTRMSASAKEDMKKIFPKVLLVH